MKNSIREVSIYSEVLAPGYVKQVLKYCEDPEGNDKKFEKAHKKFEKAYIVGKSLGKGGFGTVFAGTRSKDCEFVAIKFVDKSKLLQWDTVSFFNSSKNTQFYYMIQLNLSS